MVGTATLLARRQAIMRFGGKNLDAWKPCSR
jgi:hypothetical protein